MKLKQALRGISPKELEAIGKKRTNITRSDLPGFTVTKYIDAIYLDLIGRENARELLDSLGGDQLSLIQYIAAVGGTIPESILLQDYFSGDKEKAERLFESLYGHGVLFRTLIHGPDGETVRIDSVPEPFSRYVEIPIHWRNSLTWCLKKMRTEEIRAIASFHGKILPKGMERPLLVFQVKDVILNRKRLKNYYNSLPASVLELLDVVTEGGGDVPMRDKKMDNHVANPHLKPMLAHSGLLFLLSDGKRGPRSGRLVMPREAYKLISSRFSGAPANLPKSTSDAILAEPARFDRILSQERFFFQDMITFLCYTAKNSMKAVRREWIDLRSLRRVRGLLGKRAGSGYLSFLTHIAMECKLIKRAATQWVCRPESLTALVDGPLQFYQSTVNCWRKNMRWNENYDDPNIHILSEYHEPRNILQKRKAILAFLSDHVGAEWVDLAAIAKYLMEEAPVFRRSRLLDSGGYYKHNRVLKTEEIIYRLLTKSLFYLGVIELGCVNDKPSACRVNSMGAWLIKNGAPPDLPPFETRGALQPNLEIVLPPNIHPKSILGLCRFCNIISGEGAYILSLSREGIRDALESGMSLEEITELLESHSLEPFPSNIRALLDECGSRFGELEVGLAYAYIKANDPLLLDEVLADPAISGIAGKRLANDIVLLQGEPPSDFRKLVALLKDRGFMPKIIATENRRKKE